MKSPLAEADSQGAGCPMVQGQVQASFAQGDRRVDEMTILAMFSGITNRTATRADIAEVGRELTAIRAEGDAAGG